MKKNLLLLPIIIVSLLFCILACNNPSLPEASEEVRAILVSSAMTSVLSIIENTPSSEFVEDNVYNGVGYSLEITNYEDDGSFSFTLTYIDYNEDVADTVISGTLDYSFDYLLEDVESYDFNGDLSITYNGSTYSVIFSYTEIDDSDVGNTYDGYVKINGYKYSIDDFIWFRNS